MKRVLLRISVFAAGSAFVLVGCAPFSEPDSPTAAEPTTPQSSPDSPAPTETPEDSAPEETPAADGSPDVAAEEGSDLDEQEGVRTNAFNPLSAELGDLQLVSSDSDPSEHMVQRDYMAADEESRMLFMVYIPGAEGDGYAPVASDSGPGFRSAVDSAQNYFEEEGFDLIERSAATDGYDWECFETLQTQSGGIDHSFCLSTGYGRVIELQRLAMHEPDEQARNSHMDDLLEEVSLALADTGS